jgi:XTP/dITP diphosphohydrolase
MKTLEVRFVSGNPHKIEEARRILEGTDVKIVPSKIKIEELQIADIGKLVQDKVLKAFARLGRPLFVEHTGLHLEQLSGLPGGLTEVFWETIKADRFAELFGNGTIRTVRATTTIGYCDGRTILQFTGEASGQIVPTPRGPRDFQWDCVFQPEGHTETFAEMGEQKNEISMRRKALDAFAKHLKEVAR